MQKFEQRLKYGTSKIRYIECENPKDDCLTHKWSRDKSLGETQIVQGRNTIRRFKDWINSLDM